MKENFDGRSKENDLIIVINNNNFLPSAKYIMIMNKEKAEMLKAYQL